MLFMLFALLVFLFAVVLLVGAPYVPTLTPQVAAALKLADCQPGDTLLELGCGDGKVLVAAGRAGLHAVGYELNPLLFLVSWLRTRRFKGRVRVVWGDFWRANWPPTEAIFVFLHPRFMARLDAAVTAAAKRQKRPIKLVSFAFTVPDRKANRELNGVHLYVVTNN